MSDDLATPSYALVGFRAFPHMILDSVFYRTLFPLPPNQSGSTYPSPYIRNILPRPPHPHLPHLPHTPPPRSPSLTIIPPLHLLPLLSPIPNPQIYLPLPDIHIRQPFQWDPSFKIRRHGGVKIRMEGGGVALSRDIFLMVKDGGGDCEVEFSGC